MSPHRLVREPVNNIRRSRADILSRATAVQWPLSSYTPSASCPRGIEQTYKRGQACQWRYTLDRHGLLQHCQALRPRSPPRYHQVSRTRQKDPQWCPTAVQRTLPRTRVQVPDELLVMLGYIHPLQWSLVLFNSDYHSRHWFLVLPALGCRASRTAYTLDTFCDITPLSLFTLPSIILVYLVRSSNINWSYSCSWSESSKLPRYGPVSLAYVARNAGQVCLEHTYPSKALEFVCMAR